MHRNELEDLIDNYNQNKGPGRQLLDHPAIRALNSLLRKDERWGGLTQRFDDYAVVQCFLDNPTTPGHASHSIYLEILRKTTRNNPDAEATAKIFAKLYHKNEYTVEYVSSSFSDARYNAAVSAENMLSADTFRIITHRRQLPDIAWALDILRLSGIGKTEGGERKEIDGQYIPGRQEQRRYEKPIVEHPKPRELAQSLYHLYSKGLLTPAYSENLELIAKCSKPKQLAEHIERLSREAFPADVPKEAFLWALVSLVNNGLDSDENQAALKEHHSLIDLINILKTFDEKKILNQDNLKHIIAHRSPLELSTAMHELKYRSCHEATFAALAQHDKPLVLAKCLAELGLNTLNSLKLLTPNYLKRIAAHPQPRAFADSMVQLHDVGLLTPDNEKAVEAHPNPTGYVTELLIKLHLVGLLNPVNRKTWASLHFPLEFSQALSKLSEAMCFEDDVPRAIRQDILDGLIKHAKIINADTQRMRTSHDRSDEYANSWQKPKEIIDVAKLIASLFSAGIYNQQNLDAYVKRAKTKTTAASPSDAATKSVIPVPRDYKGIAALLKAADIFTAANMGTMVATGSNPKTISKAIDALHTAKILKQESFDDLMSPKHRWLLSDAAVKSLWNKLPANQLTEAVFKKLLLISQNNPDLGINMFLEQLQPAAQKAQSPKTSAAAALLGTPDKRNVVRDVADEKKADTAVAVESNGDDAATEGRVARPNTPAPAASASAPRQAPQTPTTTATDVKGAERGRLFSAATQKRASIDSGFHNTADEIAAQAVAAGTAIRESSPPAHSKG